MITQSTMQLAQQSIVLLSLTVSLIRNPIAVLTLALIITLTPPILAKLHSALCRGCGPMPGERPAGRPVVGFGGMGIVRDCNWFAQDGGVGRGREGEG